MSAGASLPGDEAYADAALTQDAKDAQNADDSAASEENGNTPEPAETKSDLLFGDLPPHPDRVTLREGFFKEPLSDTICKTINGVSYHENDTITYEDLSYLQVLYVDYEKNTRTGELICNKKIADDLLEIFSELYDAGYEICRIRLIDEYGGDDDASCADDNTSCFNYRVVQGTTHLSNHAKGLAIDINPFYNPYVTYPDGKERISPPGSEPYADRSSIGPHMIDENDLCYRLFTEHGFKWGGHWKSLKDYQHFEKP
ncbi:MAG: M15 family metallopeptidase [Lachnospiraceae bacterium]|nr:M15 family metallopeptidase [Lachnospiraceae bacterium]